MRTLRYLTLTAAMVCFASAMPAQQQAPARRSQPSRHATSRSAYHPAVYTTDPSNESAQVIDTVYEEVEDVAAAPTYSLQIVHTDAATLDTAVTHDSLFAIDVTVQNAGTQTAPVSRIVFSNNAAADSLHANGRYPLGAVIPAIAPGAKATVRVYLPAASIDGSTCFDGTIEPLMTPDAQLPVQRVAKGL